MFLLQNIDRRSVCESGQMVIFADDTAIINAGKRTDAAITNVTVSKWFESSKLTIKPDKCEAMFFGSANLIT